MNVLLTTSESLLTCWNIREAKTIPDIRTVGSAMLLVDSRDGPIRTVTAAQLNRSKNLRFSNAVRHEEAPGGACFKQPTELASRWEQKLQFLCCNRTFNTAATDSQVFI